MKNETQTILVACNGLLMILLAAGCNESSTSTERTASTSPKAALPGIATKEIATKAEVLKAVAELEEAANANAPPEPVFVIPEVDGWIMREPSTLPPEDHGFTVAYNHPTMVVTLYHYTRNQASISDDPEGASAKFEMAEAEAGIQSAVELGMWQKAEKVGASVTQLGTSPTMALWSRHQLTDEGDLRTSDTYVWIFKNTVLKLRCTTRSETSTVEQEMMAHLLTEIGNACEASK